MSLGVLRNACSVVGKRNLHEVAADAGCLKQHVADGAVGKAVGDGVENQVRQHLPVSARVAVHDDVGGDMERQGVARFGQTGNDAGHDLLGCDPKVKAAAICETAIDGDLLERLNK